MKTETLRIVTVAAATLAAGAALADHNSPMGEGWANMPNDIHNTRVETKGDNETFRDFVKQGGGAESVNRYAEDDNGRKVKAGNEAARKEKNAAGERQRSRDARAAGRLEQERNRSRTQRLEGRSLTQGAATRSRSMGGAGRRGRH
jgi:hypothetical protein